MGETRMVDDPADHDFPRYDHNMGPTVSSMPPRPIKSQEVTRKELEGFWKKLIDLPECRYDLMEEALVNYIG